MADCACMLMRGGTSKGAYFLAEDLPADAAERDELLLRVMGSPDPRQIDGIGGAHPLTSKVAVVSPSEQPDVDVDYLFLQLGVDEATVSDRQNCGNLLAGVGPFAVERGLVAAGAATDHGADPDGQLGQHAVARFPTPGGVVDYSGATAISGVPGTAAPIVLDFADTEGSAGHGLLPTGNLVDRQSTACGSPAWTTACRSSSPTPATSGSPATSPWTELAADDALRERIQSLRAAGRRADGPRRRARTARCPRRRWSRHRSTAARSARARSSRCGRTASIGVLGAVSVVTAVLLDGAVGHDIAQVAAGRHADGRRAPDRPPGGRGGGGRRRRPAAGAAQRRGPHGTEAVRRHRLSPR